jgi:hypothetical protein
MRSSEDVQKLIRNAEMHSDPESNQAVLKDLLDQFDKTQEKKMAVTQPKIRRIIVKSPITKIAAAAVIIVGVALSLTIWDKTTPTAYALVQTVEASHSVRYLHIRNSFASQEGPMECWVEFDSSGQLKNMRFHKPAWMSPSDGESVIVWKDNKMQLWIKKKNLLVTLRDEEVAEQALAAMEQLDPKTAVELLQQEQEKGNVEIKIDEPSNKTEPIIVTATSTQQDDDSPFQRVVLSVDQATKLVNVTKLYSLKDGEYHNEITVEYYEYNQPIDEKTFALDDVPENVIRMDQTAQEVGLVQGDLTDDEIAVEVIRQFLEALIAEDYAKAGRLFGGVPSERIRKTYGRTKFIRIVSLGQPTKDEPTGQYKVPCEIEIEKDGQITIWKPEHSYARPVHGQPDRWEITGGFLGF